MYGIPSGFDPSLFIGRELQQVSFTVNTVHLTFDDEFAITIESSFLFQPDKTAPASRQTLPVRESNLMSLLGHQVSAARSAADRDLILEFTGGGVLTCIDDSREYESYHIWIHGEQIVI